MSLNKSNIDYLKLSGELITRPGYTLNIITGCEHWHMPEICACGTDCYAYRMVTRGRLKGSKSYPYGFAPTFHPERIRSYGGKPKLLFLNDMGDCGGDWNWMYDDDPEYQLTPKRCAEEMRRFAYLNPDHIILLLTKRPEWYGLVDEWPGNVICGFSATNNEEMWKRLEEMGEHPAKQTWMSFEPWLDDKPPGLVGSSAWLVIGGLSGPNARPVSEATLVWLIDPTVRAKRFTKVNALPKRDGAIEIKAPREYPESWRVEATHDT